MVLLGSPEPSPAARRLAGILAGAGMCQVASCTGASLRRAPPGGSPTWTSSEHGFQALREGARAVSLMAWALCLLLAKQDTGQLKARGIHTLLGTGVAWVHRVGRFTGSPTGLGLPYEGWRKQMLGAVLGVPAGCESREEAVNSGWRWRQGFLEDVGSHLRCLWSDVVKRETGVGPLGLQSRFQLPRAWASHVNTPPPFPHLRNGQSNHPCS